MTRLLTTIGLACAVAALWGCEKKSHDHMPPDAPFRMQGATTPISASVQYDVRGPGDTNTVTFSWGVSAPSDVSATIERRVYNINDATGDLDLLADADLVVLPNPASSSSPSIGGTTNYDYLVDVKAANDLPASGEDYVVVITMFISESASTPSFPARFGSELFQIEREQEGASGK